MVHNATNHRISSKNVVVIKSSGIEQEVIILKAIKELIDSIVNFELMSLLGNDPDSQIAFKGYTHQRFFNIILVDFCPVLTRKALLNKPLTSEV